jgi:hypothetical protein
VQYGPPPGQYGPGQYPQPGQYGGPGSPAQPGQYPPLGQYGPPGQYGAPPGQPGQYDPQTSAYPPGMYPGSGYPGGSDQPPKKNRGGLLALIVALGVLVAGGVVAAIIYFSGGDDDTSATDETDLVPTAQTDTAPTDVTPSETTFDTPSSATPLSSLTPTLETGGTTNKPALVVARKFLTEIKEGHCKAAYALGGSIFKRTYKNELACTDSWRQALSDWTPRSPGLYYDQQIFGRYKFNDGTVVSLQQENGKWVVLSYIPSF